MDQGLFDRSFFVLFEMTRTVEATARQALGEGLRFELGVIAVGAGSTRVHQTTRNVSGIKNSKDEGAAGFRDLPGTILPSPA